MRPLTLSEYVVVAWSNFRLNLLSRMMRALSEDRGTGDCRRFLSYLNQSTGKSWAYWAVQLNSTSSPIPFICSSEIRDITGFCSHETAEKQSGEVSEYSFRVQVLYRLECLSRCSLFILYSRSEVDRISLCSSFPNFLYCRFRYSGDYLFFQNLRWISYQNCSTVLNFLFFYIKYVFKVCSTLFFLILRSKIQTFSTTKFVIYN